MPAPVRMPSLQTIPILHRSLEERLSVTYYQECSAASYAEGFQQAMAEITERLIREHYPAAVIEDILGISRDMVLSMTQELGIDLSDEVEWWVEWSEELRTEVCSAGSEQVNAGNV